MNYGPKFEQNSSYTASLFMSLSTILQRCVSPVRIIRRHVSAKSPKAPSHRTLPDAKMRALISLYHQSDTFITPENLLERIDEVFLPSDPSASIRPPITLRDLHNALHDQRNAPLSTEWDSAPSALLASDYPESKNEWSAMTDARELKVIEALYGVDTTHNRVTMPGLEVLEESVDTLEQNLADDLEEDLKYTEPELDTKEEGVPKFS